MLDGAGDEGLPELAREHLTRDESLCCEPNPTAVHFYDDAYRRYQDSVRAVTPLYH